MSPLRPGGARHTEKDWKSTQGLSATGVGSNPHLPRRPVSTTSGRSPAPCKRGRPGTAPHGGGLEESQRSRTSPGFRPKCPVASYSPPLRKCHRFPSALRQSRSLLNSRGSEDRRQGELSPALLVAANPVTERPPRDRQLPVPGCREVTFPAACVPQVLQRAGRARAGRAVADSAHGSSRTHL